jgi:HPt (histidine-containing phosphotransfer) domain-containing protein
MESQSIPCVLSSSSQTGPPVLDSPLKRRLTLSPVMGSALPLKRVSPFRANPYQNPVLQTLDWPLALRRATNQAPLAREILQLLLNFLPQVTQQITQLLQGVEDPDILDWIHKLHGGSLCSGVPRLTALCHTLESELRKGTAYHALVPEWLSLLDERPAIEQAAIRWLT